MRSHGLRTSPVDHSPCSAAGSRRHPAFARRNGRPIRRPLHPSCRTSGWVRGVRPQVRTRPCSCSWPARTAMRRSKDGASSSPNSKIPPCGRSATIAVSPRRWTSCSRSLLRLPPPTSSASLRSRRSCSARTTRSSTFPRRDSGWLRSTASRESSPARSDAASLKHSFSSRCMVTTSSGNTSPTTAKRPPTHWCAAYLRRSEPGSSKRMTTHLRRTPRQRLRSS